MKREKRKEKRRRKNQPVFNVQHDEVPLAYIEKKFCHLLSAVHIFNGSPQSR